MLPWKRKEVYLGTSMQDFYKVQTVLAENNIKYDSRIADKNTLGRGWGRTPAETRWDSSLAGQDCNVTYYIYVAKPDFEAAGYLIKNR